MRLAPLSRIKRVSGPVEERVEYSRCDSNKPTEVLAEEFLLLAEDSKDTAHTTAGRIGLRAYTRASI